MTHNDVPSYDMDDRDLTDLELDELLGGAASPAAGSSPVAKFVDDARSALDNVSPGVPTAALREFIHVAPVEVPITVAIPAEEVIELVSLGSAGWQTKRRVVPALAAFTLFGALVAGAFAIPGIGGGGEDHVVADATTSTATASGVPGGAPNTNNPAVTSSSDGSTDASLATADSSTTGQTNPGATQPTSNFESGSSAPQSSSGGSNTSDSPSSTSGGSSTSEGASSTSSSVPSSGSSTSSTSTSTTSSTSPSSSTTVPETVANQSFSYSVPGVVSLTVSVVNGYVSMSNIVPSPGWTIKAQHTDGEEAEVRVTDGTFEVRIEAEVDDSLLKVHVRDDRDEGLDTESNFDDGAVVGEPVVKRVSNDEPDDEPHADDDSDHNDDPDVDDDDSDDSDDVHDNSDSPDDDNDNHDDSDDPDVDDSDSDDNDSDDNHDPDSDDNDDDADSDSDTDDDDSHDSDSDDPDSDDSDGGQHF